MPSWDESQKTEVGGSEILDAYFSKRYLVVNASREHQRMGIDRFFIPKDKVELHPIDYKIDFTAARTGNIALEDISVLSDSVDKPGWVHTTSAEYICSYVPSSSTAYIMPVAQIRNKWDEIKSTFAPRYAETTKSDDSSYVLYRTMNYCPSIRWLIEKQVIIKTIQLDGKFPGK